MEPRTDLALEAHEIHATGGVADGIELTESEYRGFKVTRVRVDEAGEKLSGKRKGEYLTLDIGRIWLADTKHFSDACEALAQQLSVLIPEGDRPVTVVGLGNVNITSDSLGPLVTDGIIVTHHLRKLNGELYSASGFGDVTALAAGVLAQTGVESAEIIKSLADRISPKCIVAVDALASRKLSRLATTVQISDSGIAPGSGVSNSRGELTQSTVGVPVISVGVPTVVDALTVAADVFSEAGHQQVDVEAVSAALSADTKSFFVTPRDMDVIVRKTAKLISDALNLTLHKGIKREEIADYLP